VPEDNYPSASEIVRNLAQLGEYEVLDTYGRFRVVRLPPPGYGGSELWVVNEKDFMWEPAASLDAAYEYLLGDEAREYNES
jgi:hypothetical protein